MIPFQDLCISSACSFNEEGMRQRGRYSENLDTIMSCRCPETIFIHREYFYSHLFISSMHMSNYMLSSSVLKYHLDVQPSYPTRAKNSWQYFSCSTIEIAMVLYHHLSWNRCFHVAWHHHGAMSSNTLYLLMKRYF